VKAKTAVKAKRKAKKPSENGGESYRNFDFAVDKKGFAQGHSNGRVTALIYLSVSAKEARGMAEALREAADWSEEKPDV
jgi:hypothetical protein